MRRLSFEQLEDRRLLSVTPEGQLFVYLLNQARHDPAAYQIAAETTADLSQVATIGPLAVNDSLFASANFHSEEMAEYNFFDHQSAVTGDWPNETARRFGYPLASYLNDDANNIESIAAGNATAASSLRQLIESTDHRTHLLGLHDFFAGQIETGIGYARQSDSTYQWYWTVHTGFRDADTAFLTGVIYDDLNRNGTYDLHEGLPDVNVATSAGSTTTNAAGGWSLATPPGVWEVSASGGDFVGPARATAVVAEPTGTTANRNVEVDFVSGLALGTVGFQTNHLPISRSDRWTMVESATATLDVLANDTDPDGPLSESSLEIISLPEHGSLQILNSKIVYQAPTNYTGTDSFSYRIRDNQGGPSQPAEVQIRIWEDGHWNNPHRALDANRDDVVTPVDALIVINYLNQTPRLPLPWDGDFSPDANRDNQVSPVDALQIINLLNADRTPPALDLQLHQDSGYDPHDSVTQNAAVEVQLTDDSGIAALTVSVDGGQPQPLLVPHQQDFTIQPDIALDGTQDGLHEVKLTALDPNGFSTMAVVSFMLDTTRPLADFDLAAARGQQSIDLQFTEPMSPGTFALPAYQLVAAAGAGDAPSVMEVRMLSTYRAQLVLDQTLPAGEFQLLITATDLAGNPIL